MKIKELTNRFYGKSKHFYYVPLSKHHHPRDHLWCEISPLLQIPFWWKCSTFLFLTEKISKLMKRPSNCVMHTKLLFICYNRIFTYRYVVHTYDSETADTMVGLVTPAETLTLLQNLFYRKLPPHTCIHLA